MAWASVKQEASAFVRSSDFRAEVISAESNFSLYILWEATIGPSNIEDAAGNSLSTTGNSASVSYSPPPYLIQTYLVPTGSGLCTSLSLPIGFCTEAAGNNWNNWNTMITAFMGGPNDIKSGDNKKLVTSIIGKWSAPISQTLQINYPLATNSEIHFIVPEFYPDFFSYLYLSPPDAGHA